MSIFLSLTYKNPDGKEAVKIEKDYKAAMKDFLRYSSYRDAKILFIKVKNPNSGLYATRSARPLTRGISPRRSSRCCRS